jgi:hypothetical protein
VVAALRAGDPTTHRLVRASGPRVQPAQAAPALSARFADLRRHFVFEYYPWYWADPWWHWDESDRRPPDDIASNYLPRLGPYDSRSRAVVEQHARWIVESGAGAVNLSWWGPGSRLDAVTPLVMDVMRDHGLKVAFHREPYDEDHGGRWYDDVLYLLREYGERRRFDALLILKDADGREGPVFKGFRTVLPRESRDCHGVVRPVADYTPDDAFRRQFDALRQVLRRDFDHITLLADTLDAARAAASGFDGIAIYDPFVAPSAYGAGAQWATSRGLVFSFNVNAGFDVIAPRVVAPDSCYTPAPFVPEAGPIDWTSPAERERAAALSAGRIAESLATTVQVQTEAALANARRGFFLTYVNSFNEWHEGTSFEPMADPASMRPVERAAGYHNPARGDYRLGAVRGLLRPILEPEPTLAPRRAANEARSGSRRRPGSAVPGSAAAPE